MSEVMTQAIIGMPYEMAMADELSSRQFHDRAQGLLADCAALEAENARLVERTGYLVEFAQQMARQQGEPYYRLLAKAALKKWSEP